MSSASNLGYGSITPLNNINGNNVNIDNSHYSARFSSNEIPGLPGLAGAKNNIDAAMGYVPGICMKGGGGSKYLKRKIKNITKHYKKMRKGSRKIKTMKRRMYKHSRQNRKSNRRHKKNHTRRHRQRGGYAQYQNNMPMTPLYKVAGVNLPANQLGLANPPPISTLTNCVNCVDNYNHYTNTGFPSKGH